MIGGFISDQVLFFVGRRYGRQFIAFFPGVAARMSRAEALLKRWDVLAIILLRFLWGLRVAVPIVIGACGIAPWRLAVFDFIGAVIWALVVGGLGYFAGQALQQWAHRLDLAVVLFLMAIVLVGGTAWNVIRARRAR